MEAIHLKRVRREKKLVRSGFNFFPWLFASLSGISSAVQFGLQQTIFLRAKEYSTLKFSFPPSIIMWENQSKFQNQALWLASNSKLVNDYHTMIQLTFKVDLSLLSWISSSNGQLISKGLFKVFICTKKYFCISALAEKRGKSQKVV